MRMDVSVPSLRDVVTAAGLDVNRTLGGGHASIELLRRRFTSRGWLDDYSHGVLVAVSRFTPGTVVLAYCVTLGWRFHGWRGAAGALAAASIPASLIVFALARTLAEIDRFAIVRTLLAFGILVAGLLVLSSAWYLVRPHLGAASRLRTLAIAAVAAGLLAFGATPVRVLMAAAALGFALPLRSADR